LFECLTTTFVGNSDQELYTAVPKLIGSAAVRIAELANLKLKFTQINRKLDEMNGVLSAKEAELRILEAAKM
jgi:hypothetical protein